MNARRIIQEAAFSLFQEKPFDSITVQMILDRAEVSRKTFYKYFSDKYQLMELFYIRFMDQNLENNYDGHNFEEIVCNLYDFVKKNQSYFRHVKDIKSQRTFWDFMSEYSYHFYESIKLYNTQNDRLTEEEHLIVIMIVEGQLAVFKNLVTNNIKLEREDFARVLCSIMPVSYKEIHVLDTPYKFRSSSINKNR